MDSDVLTNSELYQLLEMIQSLVSIEDSNQFIALACSFSQLIEYNSIIFGLPDQSSDIPETIIDLNISYPQDWVNLYQEKNFSQIDPIVVATKATCAPQHWGDIYKKYPPDKNFLGLAHNFGLKDGWSCLTKATFGLPWMILSVGGEYKQSTYNSIREEFILKRIAPHFHIALSSLNTKCKPDNPLGRLTKREQEVIKWLSHGKTTWEISVILNVAEVTVNFHIKNIKDKLNSVNRSQAVAIATRWITYSNVL